MFWGPIRLNELPYLRFEFPFNLIGKSTMAFLTGQGWHIVKSWYKDGAQNKDFRAGSETDLTRGLVAPVTQANIWEFQLSV